MILQQRKRLDRETRKRLIVVRRRRGAGAELRDSDQAAAWAQSQPWWPRCAELGATKDWWVWKCTP